MVGLKTVGIVFAVALAAGAAAQEFGGRQGGRGGQPGSALALVLDTNRDGVIGADELAAAPAALKTLDRNGNGIIESAELMMMGRGRGEGFDGGRGDRDGGRGGEPGGASATSADELVATLMAFDKNTDGKLSKDELPERLQAMFDRADTNKDGVLTASEIRASAQSSTQSASAGMGRGKREGRGGPEGRGRGPGGVDPIFSALDTNHDGALQAEEIANAPAALRTLDRNQDGRLTADEYQAFGNGRMGRQV